MKKKIGLRKRNRFQKNRSRKRLAQNTSHYEALEPRQVLASLFPTFIDGQFTLGNGPGAATPYDLADTFKLESNPAATKTVYLDFDGHHSVDNAWGHDIVFPAFNREGGASSFSDAELLEIQLQFQNVAEDFLPFDVNVTTRDPGVDALMKSGNNDQYYGVRAINTQPTDGFGNGIGGVAYLNSFDSDYDDPVFTFNKGANNGATTNSHEVGHALGLYHDGLGNNTYHPGTGSGETSWGPIMGAPFGENVTQWSNGDYANSTQTEDDFSVITSNANGFGFRQDLVGNTFSAAAELVPAADGSVLEWNIIERNTDVDVYSFEAAGNVSIAVNAFDGRPNLDVLARIFDSNGNLVAQSNPTNSVNASFDLDLESGRYFLAIDGVGKADVYSDYGSIGLYTIEGSIGLPEDGGETAGLAIGETGRLSINHNWTTVTLNHAYIDPVVIAGPAAIDGGDPVTVRVRNVSRNSFEIRIDEWDYLSGTHFFETVDYMVVEAGEHTLSDGTILVAGNQSGQTHSWSNYDLGDSFEPGIRPIVLSQIVTNSESSAATTRMRFTSDSEFQIKIQEQESNTQSHAAETVSYIAIQSGLGVTGELNFEAIVTGDTVTHELHELNFNGSFESAPAFFANMQTHDGPDTATVRYSTIDRNGVEFFLEEEQSKNREIVHTTENVGVLAIQFGDIMVVDDDRPDLPPNPPIEFGFESSVTTPVSSKLWKAVLVQQSWEEMALSVDHQDFADHNHEHEHEHDHRHDHDGEDPCCCADCQGSRENSALIGVNIDLATQKRGFHEIETSPQKMKYGAGSLKLAGSIESASRDMVVRDHIEQAEKFDFEIDDIDEVFRTGLELPI